jgi:aromatic-L-amino-acid decarboxylase
VVYASDQAHSSVDKAVMTLGLGLDGVRRVRSDRQYRLDPRSLEAAILEDRAAGKSPMAVVATAGTTSTTSIDPIEPIAQLCRDHRLWLHVDAAYGGAAAICPELQRLFTGWERADSIVVNPHKWLFVPVDCSVLLVRDLEALRAAFSIVPAYLESAEQATNLMDLGIQLGRRFRALKLWMVIRCFGVEGLRARVREHCKLARRLAERIEDERDWELAAPVPLSVVCFRSTAPATDRSDAFHRQLLARVNADGGQLLSSTELDGHTILRIAIGNLRTEWRHVEKAWARICSEAERLLARTGPSEQA